LTTGTTQLGEFQTKFDDATASFEEVKWAWEDALFMENEERKMKIADAYYMSEEWVRQQEDSIAWVLSELDNLTG